MKIIKRILVASLCSIGMTPLFALASELFDVISPVSGKIYNYSIPIHIVSGYELECMLSISKQTLRGETWQEISSYKYFTRENPNYGTTSYPDIFYFPDEFRINKNGKYSFTTQCKLRDPLVGNYNPLASSPGYGEWSEPRIFLVSIPEEVRQELGDGDVKTPITALTKQGSDVPVAMQPSPVSPITAGIQQAPTALPVFGAKTRELTAAQQPMSGPAPGGLPPVTKGIFIENKPAPVMTGPALGSLTPQPGTTPALTRQPLTSPPTMKPLSGPDPKLQPAPMAKAPAVAIPMPMTRQRVDTSSQKAPVTAELPGIKRQFMPVITFPRDRQNFPAPAGFTVRANYANGYTMVYGLKSGKAGWKETQRNTTGRFSNLPPGLYCVYVAYQSNGPASRCVEFWAMDRRALTAPTKKPMATPPTPARQPVATPPSPAPMQKIKPMPVPMTPGG